MGFAFINVFGEGGEGWGRVGRGRCGRLKEGPRPPRRTAWYSSTVHHAASLGIMSNQNLLHRAACSASHSSQPYLRVVSSSRSISCIRLRVLPNSPPAISSRCCVSCHVQKHRGLGKGFSLQLWGA